MLFTILSIALLLTALTGPAVAGDHGFSTWVFSEDSNVSDPVDSVWEAGGPHANVSGEAYATTGSGCSICHDPAAAGTFQLTAGDPAEDACIYCHVDDGRYTGSRAYTGDEGVYPSNGHTLGAGPDIPSSSVRQWLEPSAQAPDMNDEGSGPRIVPVRRYDSRQQKLFIYTGVRTEVDGERRLARYGPISLTCVSCHQPHNSADLVWKPPGAPGGYKLLRASPSGSLLTGNPLYDPLTYSGEIDPGLLGPGAVVKVPEEDFGPENTGHNLGKDQAEPDAQTASRIFTTWTQWAGSTETLTSLALSVWCADCHNLQIGANAGDRTHVAGTEVTQCYACHRDSGDGGRLAGNTAGWEPYADPSDSRTGDCDRCHYGAARYGMDNSTNDFPHSGAERSAKLLPDWYDAEAGEALDQTCKYCHDLLGSDM